MSSTVLNGNSNFTLNNNVFSISLENGPNEVHIRTLNKLLSASKTFGKGLELINSFLDYGQTEALNEHLNNWIDCCLKSSGDVLVERKLSLIKKLIEASFTNPDTSKKVTSDYLSKILDLCLSQKGNYHEDIAALDALAMCMQKYGSWFASKRDQIEKFLISYLEDSCDAVIEKAGVAFLVLQQVGNAGPDSANHRKFFKESLGKLCATVHVLLDDFFQNMAEVELIEKPHQEGYHFNNQFLDTQQIVQVNAVRIKNVIKFIKIMIKNSFPVFKDVFPMDILNMIYRGTLLHHCVSASANNSQEDYHFCLLLNTIQVELIHLLGMFISWLQNNSLPYAYIISKILIDCLKKSQNCKCFNFDVLYQETVYVTIKTWICTSRTGLNSHFQASLITCILKDITPVKNQVILKIQTDIIKKTGQGKRKNAHNNLLSSKQFNIDISKNKIEREKDELKCELALEALISLFDHGFIRVDPKIIQEIYTLIIAIINEINTTAIPHPYTNPKCQASLYKLLTSFYEQETLKHLPPISVALKILEAHSSSKNNEISAICRQGLNRLERLCQPITPPFTIVVYQEEETLTDESIIMECIADISESHDEHVSPETENIQENGNTSDKSVLISEKSEISSAGNISTDKDIKILENIIINEANPRIVEPVSIPIVVGSETGSDHESGEFKDEITILDDELIDVVDIEDPPIKIEETSSIEAMKGSEIDRGLLESESDATIQIGTCPIIGRSRYLDTEDEPSVKRIKTSQATNCEASVQKTTAEAESSNSDELSASFVDEIGEY